MMFNWDKSCETARINRALAKEASEIYKQRIDKLEQQNAALVNALDWAIAKLEINKDSLDVMINELNKALALAEANK